MGGERMRGRLTMLPKLLLINVVFLAPSVFPAPMFVPKIFNIELHDVGKNNHFAEMIIDHDGIAGEPVKEKEKEKGVKEKEKEKGVKEKEKKERSIQFNRSIQSKKRKKEGKGSKQKDKEGEDYQLSGRNEERKKAKKKEKESEKGG